MNTQQQQFLYCSQYLFSKQLEASQILCELKQPFKLAQLVYKRKYKQSLIHIEQILDERKTMNISLPPQYMTQLFTSTASYSKKFINNFNQASQNLPYYHYTLNEKIKGDKTIIVRRLNRANRSDITFEIKSHITTNSSTGHSQKAIPSIITEDRITVKMAFADSYRFSSIISRGFKAHSLQNSFCQTALKRMSWQRQ